MGNRIELDRARAKSAWSHSKTEFDWLEALPVLIRKNGLAQAMLFVKNKDEKLFNAVVGWLKVSSLTKPYVGTETDFIKLFINTPHARILEEEIEIYCNYLKKYKSNGKENREDNKNGE